MMVCSLGAVCFMGTHLQINVCFYTWTTITGVCCVCCSYSHISRDSCLCQKPENQLKGYILVQIENNKPPSSRLSPGVTGQTGSLAAVWLAGQLVQNLSAVTSQGGIKGVWLQHLNLPVALKPAPQISQWQPSHSWGRRHKCSRPHNPLCSVQFVNEQSMMWKQRVQFF